MITAPKPFPTVKHVDRCMWHFDQYRWECDCGAYERAGRENTKASQHASSRDGGKWPGGDFSMGIEE